MQFNQGCSVLWSHVCSPLLSPPLPFPPLPSPLFPSHYPTTKFTQVADTPEGRRLTEQTARQSEVHMYVCLSVCGICVIAFGSHVMMQYALS